MQHLGQNFEFEGGFFDPITLLPVPSVVDVITQEDLDFFAIQAADPVTGQTISPTIDFITQEDIDFFAVAEAAGRLAPGIADIIRASKNLPAGVSPALITRGAATTGLFGGMSTTMLLLIGGVILFMVMRK